VGRAAKSGALSLARWSRIPCDPRPVEREALEKIRDGGEFTSVGEGLAFSAPLFFPELH